MDTNVTTNATSSYFPEYFGPSAALLHKVDIVVYTMTASYGALLVASMYVLYVKLRSQLKLRTSVLYVCYTFVLAFFRFVYLLLVADDKWAKLQTSKGGLASYIFFDMIPELLFISVFILMTITLGLAWSKSRNLKVFKDSTLMITHSITVFIIFLVGGLMCIDPRTKDADTGIRWESIYIAIVSGVAVGLSGAIGFGFYNAVRKSAKKMESIVNKPKLALLKQLVVLIVLTMISFIFKAVWNLTLGIFLIREGKIELALIVTPLYVASEIIPVGYSLYLQWKSEKLKTPVPSKLANNRVGPNEKSVSVSVGT